MTSGSSAADRAMQQAQSANQAPGDPSAAGTAFAWLLAWTVMGVILWALNRTRIGHIVIYYLLVLMIVLLLVTNAGWFAQALQPFTDAVTGQGVDQSGGSDPNPAPEESTQ